MAENLKDLDNLKPIDHAVVAKSKEPFGFHSRKKQKK